MSSHIQSGNVPEILSLALAYIQWKLNSAIVDIGLEEGGVGVDRNFCFPRHRHCL